MENSFYSYSELESMGFISIGKDVSISKKTSIYYPHSISIGNHVRIDDYCILSGNIILHDYIHIAAGCYLFAGNAGIEMCDFSGLSSGCVLYAISDSYKGDSLTNPTVPDKYRNVTGKKIIIEKHGLIGTKSTLLPGVKIGVGSAVGAMSLVVGNVKPFSIYFGIPAKKISERSNHIIDLESVLRNESDNLSSS